MTVQTTADGDIVLTGACPSEDAETLLRQLAEQPGAVVDWRGCETAHAAVVQVLMASAAAVRGPAAGAFLREWVEPLLAPG